MRNSNITSLLNGNTRNLNESQWLEVLKYLTQKLGEKTSANIEVGSYWIHDEPDSHFSSLTARVRAKTPLFDIDSDYWESALCLTAQDGKTYVDAYVFPYLNEIRVSQFGRLDNELAIQKGDEIFWRIQFSDGEFQSRGWANGDGPDEWSWVVNKGDEFRARLECILLKNEFKTDEPIYADINVPALPQLLADSAFLKLKKPRLSLINVNRNRENTNLVPWNTNPPKPNSKNAISIEDFSNVKPETVRLDLRQFNIRGDWKSGKYRISIRIQNFEKSGWSFNSEISAPLIFSIT